MKAIATYKEDYGSRLATYAARCIDNELLMYFRAKKKVSREVSVRFLLQGYLFLIFSGIRFPALA